MHLDDVVVPFTNLEGSEQAATLIGENPTRNKSYDKNRQFQLLQMPIFSWAEHVYKEKEITKVILQGVF